VVVDGVFSMGGDIVDLPKLVSVCKTHGARIYVDDATRSASSRRPRHRRPLQPSEGSRYHHGHFSKSFASLGGFIVGDEDVIDYVKHFARSFIFSASLPASNVMAAMRPSILWRTSPST